MSLLAAIFVTLRGWVKWCHYSPRFL